MHQKVLSMILVLVMLLGLLSVSAFTMQNTTSSDSAASNADSFYRIVHLDCGRKYFSVSEIKDIIDKLAANHYTHLQLAFGNDGLRFLLDDMSVGKYTSNAVTSAIREGNKAFYDAGTNELTQAEMTEIISYAREEGIGIIPMFDAPGHLQVVVKAMQELGMHPAYTTPTKSGTSWNYAIDTTDNASTSFVKALMQKYITYFQGQGCTMFNFAADECGFDKMEVTAYTSYAEFVNELAAMVKSANMTPMAFNDGIYHLNLKTNTAFDTSIVVCYWDASDSLYTSAADLARIGFKILNTNNKWYYVIGKENVTGWNDWKDYAYTCEYAKNQMAENDCLTIDGDNKQTTPVGCMAAIWCDTPSASVNWDNVKSYISTFSTSNPNYFKASATTPEKPGVQQPTENKTVSVTVGGTTMVTIDDKNLSADGQTYETENSGIATVTVSGQNEQPGNVTYSKANVSYSALAGSNDTWTRTDYYYKDGNNYYPVYAYREYYGYGSGYDYYYRCGYYTTDSTTDVNEIGGSWYGRRTVTVYSKSGQEMIPASTTLTFKGVAVGTTYVTIDNVKYTIQVTQENLEGKKLHMQLWFTNCDIEAPANGSGYDGKQTSGEFLGTSWPENKKPYYIDVAAAGAYGEDGVPLTAVLPASMTRYEYSATYWINAKDGKAAKELVLWSGRVHDSDSDNIQLIGGKDYSNSGSEFQYVRYYDGHWAVSVDRANWTNVTGEGSTASASSCKEQLAVYYMMRSQITKEVSTDVADWGYINSDRDAYNGQIEKNQYVMLDFAVKYQDNTRNPSTFPQNGKTFLFHCTPNDGSGAVKQDSSKNYYRQLNNFRGMNTGDYEIYMITVTMTDGSASNTIADTTSYTYDYKNTEQIVWAIDEATKDKSGLDPYTSISGSSNYSGCKIGGDPYVRGVEVYNQHGALITYYVRAKITTDALQVHYVNQTTGYEFYNYPIVVNSGTYFSPDFAYVSGSAQESGSLTGNTVTNSLGVVQTVKSDLASIPEIGAQYRYGNYKFVNAKRDDDKNVTLYYTFNTTKKFVVDFGLPLTIRPQDIASQLANANLTRVVVDDSQYADITHDDSLNIIYKLKKAINGQDDITFTYYGTNAEGKENKATYTVSIIPATSVYYEDSFATFSGDWTPAGKTEENAVQHLDELGKTGANNYGYDDQYNNSNRFSLGSAMKTTVSRATNNDPPTATFTFKGTGFDLVSMTSKDTGTILVNVNGTTEDNKTVTEHWIVDTFYGYTRKQQGYIEYTWTKGSDGKWHNKAIVIPDLPEGVTIGGTPTNSDDKTYEPNYTWTPVDKDDNALYQIPVIHYTDLPYGEYTVTVTPKYSRSRDPYYDANGDNNSYDFYLDGVRIYNPAGDKLNSQYVLDGEGYAQFTEIRNMLLDASDLKANIEPTTGMVFVDGVGDKGTLKDYTNYGPNNEVYLSKNQAIAFKISDISNVDSVQIGAKAPNGNATMQIQVGNNKPQKQELKTASDMYYKLNNVQADQTIVITNTSESDSLLSLTTLKVTYKSEPSTSNSADPVVDEEVVAQAPVMLMSMLYGEPQTFEPEHFTAKWSRNVRKGGTATLTVKASADVESITVNGEEITAYTTKTARSFWGPKETYHVFTYRVTNATTADYTVCALNAEGIASDPITAPLTVRPSIRDWWNGIFDKWKH